MRQSDEILLKPFLYEESNGIDSRGGSAFDNNNIRSFIKVKNFLPHSKNHLVQGINRFNDKTGLNSAHLMYKLVPVVQIGMKLDLLHLRHL